jgi:hypothetical protein
MSAPAAGRALATGVPVSIALHTLGMKVLCLFDGKDLLRLLLVAKILRGPRGRVFGGALRFAIPTPAAEIAEKLAGWHDWKNMTRRKRNAGA